MPIISVGIMKTIDKRDLQKKKITKSKGKTNKGRKEQENRSYSERVRVK